MQVVVSKTPKIVSWGPGVNYAMILLYKRYDMLFYSVKGSGITAMFCDENKFDATCFWIASAKEMKLNITALQNMFFIVSKIIDK